MSFYRDTVRTARKEHKCELCGAVIQKGEKYHDKAGNELGDIFYSKEWNAFCRSWQRPAAVEAHMKSGTDFRNFGT